MDPARVSTPQRVGRGGRPSPAGGRDGEGLHPFPPLLISFQSPPLSHSLTNPGRNPSQPLTAAKVVASSHDSASDTPRVWGMQGRVRRMIIVVDCVMIQASNILRFINLRVEKFM